MQYKIDFSPEQALTVRQDEWAQAPCRDCVGAPCCTVLPLTSLRLESRMDFMNLALLACYDHIRLLRKKHGEWTVYYAKTCAELDGITSQCLIHGAPNQNMICTSYDAHTCWYRAACAAPQNDKVIFFNLDRLMFLEKKTDLFRHSGNMGDLEWDDLCRDVSSIPCPTTEATSGGAAVVSPLFLPFRKCAPEHVLFFPPFAKPQQKIHFELAAFRLGFSGVSLAVSDNYWAYMLRAELNRELFGRLTAEYFPALEPRHGAFGFPELHKRMAFFSQAGERWLLLNREQIPILKRMVRYDAFGNITDIPSIRELSAIMRPSAPIKPDKAA